MANTAPQVRVITSKIKKQALRDRFMSLSEVAGSDTRENFFHKKIMSLLSEEKCGFIDLPKGSIGHSGVFKPVLDAYLGGKTGSIYIGIDERGRRVIVVAGVLCNNLVFWEGQTVSRKNAWPILMNHGEVYQDLLEHCSIADPRRFHRILALPARLSKFYARVTRTAEKNRAKHAAE
jgi:hypothetical protein